MNQGLILELILFAIVIILLVVYLFKNKDKIHIQPIVGFGKFNIISMALVRTGWGIDKMDEWAKKHREWVRLFGLVSIGVGFVAILLNIVMIIVMIKNLIAAPSATQVSFVLPFTNIPGLGYLAFSHWLIAIFILATVHEFAHGVVSRALNIPVKNSGFAVLKLFYIPLVPAAFVEPDEKQFPKRSDVDQYSVLTAGPVSNIFLAIPFLLLFLFVFNPLTTHMTQPVGFSFNTVNENNPAANANITANTPYNYVNGHLTNDSTEFYKNIWFNAKPGDQLTIGYYNYTTNELSQHQITTIESPTDKTTAYIGVVGITDVREFKPEYKPYQVVFNWFKDLCRIIFLFNLLVGIFNLMPLFVTDGGQIVRVFTKQLYGKDKNKADKVYKLICSLCLYALIAAFIIPLFF